MKIQSCEIYPVVYPLKAYFKFFETSRGQSGRPTVVLKIVSDTGTVGWGQAVPTFTWSYETLETTMIVLGRYLCPALIGQKISDISDIAGIHKLLDAALHPLHSTIFSEKRLIKVSLKS